MNVKNVTASKPSATGAFLVAPYGSPIPEFQTLENGNVIISIPEEYATVGYLSEDGYEHDGSIETSSVKAWGGYKVLDSETGKKDDYKVSLLEYKNKLVQQIINGDDSVDGEASTGMTIDSRTDPFESRAWLIHEILKDGTEAVTIIPNGTITAVDADKHSDGSPISYPVTISALPDPALDNRSHRVLILDKQ